MFLTRCSTGFSLTFVRNSDYKPELDKLIADRVRRFTPFKLDAS